MKVLSSFIKKFWFLVLPLPFLVFYLIKRNLVGKNNVRSNLPNSKDSFEISYNDGSDSSVLRDGVVDLSLSIPPTYVKWNNPLNIRFNKANDWQGKLNPPKNGNFEEFESLDAGTRAAVKLLVNYFKQGYNTLDSIINRWAPSSDGNNTARYISNVSKRTGFSPLESLNLRNKHTMSLLVSAMSVSEKADGEHIPFGYVMKVIDQYKLL